MFGSQLVLNTEAWVATSAVRANYPLCDIEVNQKADATTHLYHANWACVWWH